MIDLLIILIGLISGLISGVIGLGSNALLILLFIFNITPTFESTVGTTLASTFSVNSVPAIINYYNQENIELEKAATLFITFAIGSYYGSCYNKYIPIDIKTTSAGLILIASGIFFLCVKHK